MSGTGKINKFILITVVFIWTVVMSRCTRSPIEFLKSADGSIRFQHSGVELHIDSGLHGSVFFIKNGRSLSLNDYGEDVQSAPLYYAVVNNKAIKNFNIQSEETRADEVNTPIGEGKRLCIKGESVGTGVPLELALYLELYDDLPNTAVTYAVFKNVSGKDSVTFDTVYTTALQLDASLIDSTRKPHAFYSFYGTDGRPSRQKEKVLPAHFNINVFTGRTEALEGIKEGNGGIPVTDIWCKEMGIGIGSLECRWKDLYTPVKVQDNGRVFIALEEVPNINKGKPLILKPGESYRTITSFIHVHALDFYSTIATYSELMKRQGLDFGRSKSTDSDYLASWCSWNDYSTHAMASKQDIMLIEPIIERLPELKKLHIGEIVFDAGWFNNQGDWLPNPDSLSFPNGEMDLINAIDAIHREGFKVKLWISFLTADPWSQIARGHPEWMIKKPNGDFHLDRWSGCTMCPAVTEVQEYHRELAHRLVEKYKADGFKVDGMYVCPPCYNEEHHHDDPNASSRDYHKVFKAFYHQAIADNPDVSITVCPCGSNCSYDILPYLTQNIAADPKTFETVRRRMKLYRALRGPVAAYSSDYIDVIKGDLTFPAMLANAVGSGAVPQTFYGKTPPADTLSLYEKWFKIYTQEMISKAEYLNLYDIHFDKPDTYVFRKKEGGQESLYYSFFSDDSDFRGEVEFRGLDKKKTYKVYDYVNDKIIGMLSGDVPRMQLSFTGYLLVRCEVR